MIIHHSDTCMVICVGITSCMSAAGPGGALVWRCRPLCIRGSGLVSFASLSGTALQKYCSPIRLLKTRVININQSNSLKRVLKCAALIAIMPLAESVFKSLLSGFSCQIFAASQAHYTLTPCFLTSHSHHTPILRLLFYSSYIPQCTTE